MIENTALITERNGEYEIRNDGISEFALIGMLECILFDLKSARNRSMSAERQNAAASERSETAREREDTDAKPKAESSEEPSAEAIEKPKVEKPKVEKPKAETATAASTTNAPELRTRIANAVKAIRALGGEADELKSRGDATDDELQTELKELTEQYKRLKNTKSAK